MSSADFDYEKDGMFRLFDQIFFGSITKQLKNRKLFKRIKTNIQYSKFKIQNSNSSDWLILYHRVWFISKYIESSTDTVVKNSSCFSPIVFLAGTWQLWLGEEIANICSILISWGRLSKLWAELRPLFMTDLQLTEHSIHPFQQLWQQQL